VRKALGKVTHQASLAQVIFLGEQADVVTNFQDAIQKELCF